MTSSGDLQTFYMVCDTSGSMAENGKRMQVRSIARIIEQYIRLGYGNGILKGKGGYPHPLFWEEVRKNTDIAVLSTDAHNPAHLHKTIGDIRKFASELDFTVLEPAIDGCRLTLRRETES